MKNDRIIKISVGESRKSLNWKTQVIHWSEFVNRIGQVIRTSEKFSDYMSYAKSQQDELKDVGGFVGGTLRNGRRKSENVIDRYLVTLDLDNIPAGETNNILTIVDGLGCAYAIYSTRKHCNNAPRLRIIIPLDRACTPDEYVPIARKIASIIGMQFMDITTFESSRLMYWPSASIDSETVYTYGDKQFVSADGILKMYKNWQDVSEWPIALGESKQKEKLASRQGEPTEKQGIVGAFCRVYNIDTVIEKYLSDQYVSCDLENRYTYLNGSTVAGAVVYQDGTFLYSHHATDPAGGKLCNAFDLVRYHKFGELDAESKMDTPVTQLPSFKAMCEFALKDEKVVTELNKERYARALTEFEDSAQTVIENNDWMKKLTISASTGAIQKTIDNVKTILSNDPKIKDTIVFDEFSNKIKVVKPCPWGQDAKDFRERVWSESDDAGLRLYIEKLYGITGKDRIQDALAVYLEQTKIHVVRDYISKLVWDGVPRIERLLVDYFGTADTIYERTIIKKSLVAAVARIFKPGTKFDNMIILAGKQGIGKSTFLKKLGKSWFSDSIGKFEGKEAYEQLRGVWIIEVPELTGFNRTEMSDIKQFLSKQEDIYREAYARRTSTFKRQCVFFGTTNDNEFLRDKTGNRRFWPVNVGLKVPIKNIFTDLDTEVDQIWAEAYELYKSGEALYLNNEVSKIAIERQEEHLESNPKEGLIREFISRKVIPGFNEKSIIDRKIFWANDRSALESELIERDRICAAEIWCECFGTDIKLMKRQDVIEINGILSTIKEFEKSEKSLRFGPDYGVQKGFVKRKA